jgi:hypothetical protein
MRPAAIVNKRNQLDIDVGLRELLKLRGALFVIRQRLPELGSGTGRKPEPVRRLSR